MSLIDKIRYGNLSKEYYEVSLRQDDISKSLEELGLYDKLFDMPPPPNSSAITQKELKNLVSHTNNISDIVLEFCKNADKDHLGLFISYLKNHGIYDITKEDLDRVTDQTYAFLIRIKDHYNRPRPYQLAYYYNIDLHTAVNSHTADTPSYPSGHSFESFIIAELLANKYPEHAMGLLKLGKNIGLSRLLIGVHYRSDHDFGRYLGKVIIENELIKRL
ncbi:phosphatase PAP2 family protein [bacterium]|nr:phosphatase PAP2 family protein [Candidatus Elulimicrobium humile]